MRIWYLSKSSFISIHAPARGATPPPSIQSVHQKFQSTLPRGERQSCLPDYNNNISFQSTLPRGERPAPHRATDEPSEISIHAPARGATHLHKVLISIRRFQSTLPRGERRFLSGTPVRYSLFQSTLPRGERLPLCGVARQVFRYFNPRSREGSDGSNWIHNAVHLVFQSTLPRGERLCILMLCAGAKGISIHAPARGATYRFFIVLSIFVFQSTLPRGERLFCMPCYHLLSEFQSTLPRGERQLINLLHFPLVKISIHAPARGATFPRALFFLFLQFQSTLPRGERHGLLKQCKSSEKFQSTLPRGERQQNCTHSQYFFRELCESCQNLQITLTNYSFFYLIICFLQSFSSANQLVFSCSLIIRTN